MIHGFFIFAAVFLAYANTLPNGFVNDDHALIEYNPSIRPGGTLGDIFLKDILTKTEEASAFYRPAQTLSYRLDHTLWGAAPWGYHLSNILYHVLAALLLLILLSFVFNDEWLAFWTVLLWAVHPIHVKVVSYAASRADILLFIFILLALIGFLKRWNTLWIMIFSLGAVLSKEAAIVLPIVLIGCGWGLDPEAPYSKKSFVSAFNRALPCLTLILWCFAFRVWVLKIPMEMISLGAEVPPLFERFLLGVRSFFILHGLIFSPFNLRFVRYLNPAGGLVAFLFDAIGLLVLMILIWLSWRMRKRVPILALGMGWTLVQYLPYFNIVPLNWNISEHWMYLPSVGIFACGVFVFADRIKGHKRLLAPILGSLVLALAALTAARNFQWKDDVTLFEPEVKAEPQSQWAHYNLASGYSQKGMTDEALKHYYLSLSLGPPRGKAYWTIGRLLIQKRQFAEAVFNYDQAVRLEPRNADYRASLADSYFLVKRFDDAEREYLKALELDPNKVTYLMGLGILYVQKEKFGSAAQIFVKVIQMDPFNQTARRNLRLLKSFSDKIRSTREERSNNVNNP